MLGAGGTDDSSQFSGVVSDEVIKVWVLNNINIERYFIFLFPKCINTLSVQDIYEATKFYSVPSLSGETASDEIFLSSVKFNINQITATLRSMYEIQYLAYYWVILMISEYTVHFPTSEYVILFLIDVSMFCTVVIH